MNIEIYEKITEIKEEKITKNTIEKEKTQNAFSKKFLIFSVNNKKYAAQADEIKEIVISDEIFFVPFVPAYVRGFINRHGQPFTVLDINLIFDNINLNSNKFLILNIPDDQLSILISDVIEILDVPDDMIKHLSSTDESSRYFQGSITSKDDEILILNITSFLNRLENDL